MEHVQHDSRAHFKIIQGPRVEELVKKKVQVEWPKWGRGVENEEDLSTSIG